MPNLLDATCRVALAGLVHDLGKFGQRAGLEVSKERLETHEQLYCPQKEIGGNIWWTHKHAAYTALFFEDIEKGAPDLVKGDAYPFASRTEGGEITDSIANAAGAHHNPKTFLQWVIAVADRVSSGFERDDYADKSALDSEKTDYITTRLRSLLEGVSLTDSKANSSDLKKALPLKPLSATSLFPQSLECVETKDVNQARLEYKNLWKAFSEAMDPGAKEPIPDAFRKNWTLWLDVFDTAWLTFTSSIPSATAFGVRPDVSLYDHCKATAAIATALWAWHEATGKTDAEAARAMKDKVDWDEKKFLLIQGDFFGIQNFIFSEGSETNKNAAKILRGRSFYVSLMTELAALKVLQTLSLPPTSQILNAAGKFMIVAPNTPQTIERLNAVKETLDAWFIKNTFATAGIGLAWTEASCRDFVEKQYDNLVTRLIQTLDREKLRRFNLTQFADPVLDAGFSQGVCSWRSMLPADGKKDGLPTCALTRDEMNIGKWIPSFKRLLVLTEDALIRNSDSVKVLELPVFGFKVAFVQDSDTSGNFSRLAADGFLLRCWDFSLPESEDEVLWHGYARRNINGYVPHYTGDDFRYRNVEHGSGKEIESVKQFEDIAAVDSHDGTGIEALMTVKGDVDNLGLIFQKGLKAGNRSFTFAKTAGLSRQLNAFFTVWLPWICRKDFPDMYTVFAGGDDFFLIGPWKESQKLLGHVSDDFYRYTGDNPEVHFSVGTVVTKSSVPVRTLSDSAEEALAKSKSHDGKNALTLYGRTIAWSKLKKLQEEEDFLYRALQEYDVSSGYLYSLFQILEMSGEEQKNPRAALWRSRLYYSTARLFERAHQSRSKDVSVARNQFLETLLHFLMTEKADFRIPLTNVFYSIRRSGREENGL